MARASRLLAAAFLAAISSGSGSASDRDPKPASVAEDKPALTMTSAVACLSIKGFDDYEVLPGAALTSDEKLLIYYRPLNYVIERNGRARHIHLVQDGQIRRRGEKAIRMAKAKILDYDWKGEEPVLQVFLQNTVALKGLKPGEYEYDITLHDKLAPGEPVARQTLPFRVVPPGMRDEKGDVKPSEDRPTSPPN